MYKMREGSYLLYLFSLPPAIPSLLLEDFGLAALTLAEGTCLDAFVAIRARKKTSLR